MSNPSNLIWKNMDSGKRKRKLKKHCCYLFFIVILIGFLLLNMSSNYMIVLIRFIQQPPNVDCSFVLSRNDNMEQKAFMEYLA